MTSSAEEGDSVMKEEEEEDYLSQICRNPDNTNSDEHVDHVSCQTPAELSKTADDFESSLEQEVFNQNTLSASSPKPEKSECLTSGTNKAADTLPDPDLTEGNSQDNIGEQSHENSGAVEGKSNEAEEIVKKLCKNGKIMHFQEGEDFIKVIVYEDSQESNDLDDTLSAEELDSSSVVNDKKDPAKPGSSKNLLECLTENTASTRYDGLCSTPLQPFAASGHYQTSMGNPPQFVYPAHQHIQPSYSFTSTGDVVHSNNVLNHSKFGSIPVSMEADQHCTPHPRNGFMFYRPSEGQATNFPVSGVLPSYQAHPVSSGKKLQINSQLQLNSSGEEQQVSPTDFKQTPTSGRGKMQPKVRSLMQIPPFPGDEWGKIREQHNQKERRRRARIKEACNLLRQLVPGMSDKTDKATVFEFAARYVHFQKSHTGTQFDKDFLMKYSPY